MKPTKDHRLPITPFRLSPDTLADLETIRAELSDTDRTARSRADALRYAARIVAEKIRKKNGKSA